MVVLANFFRWAQRTGDREARDVRQMPSERVQDVLAMEVGKPGCPGAVEDICELVRHMAQENPTWGEGRIADELSLKLGLRVSPPLSDGRSFPGEKH